MGSFSEVVDVSFETLASPDSASWAGPKARSQSVSEAGTILASWMACWISLFVWPTVIGACSSAGLLGGPLAGVGRWEGENRAVRTGSDLVAGCSTADAEIGPSIVCADGIGARGGDITVIGMPAVP